MSNMFDNFLIDNENAIYWFFNPHSIVTEKATSRRARVVRTQRYLTMAREEGAVAYIPRLEVDNAILDSLARSFGKK